MSCYLNKIQSIGLRKYPYEHQLANKAYLSDITVANISESFTHKTAAKTSWHRYESKLRHCHSMYIYHYYLQHFGAVGLTRAQTASRLQKCQLQLYLLETKSNLKYGNSSSPGQLIKIAGSSILLVLLLTSILLPLHFINWPGVPELLVLLHCESKKNKTPNSCP